MRFPVHSTSGQIVREIELSADIFATPMNKAVVHQAMVRQLANRRLGTASTKRRGEVSGSTKKLYRQKHTGFARAGSRRSPLRRGGGIVFGPHPRSYRQSMPKKMRRLALRCVLSAKAADGELILVDVFGFKQPKTKEMAGILTALGVHSSALIATSQPDINLLKSCHNLGRIRVLPAPLLNVVDLLTHRALILDLDAVEKVEELWGGGTASGGIAITSLRESEES